MGKYSKAERFWLDEDDPKELERRARDLERDGFIAAARELRLRAAQLLGWE
jgi:hypothetical protein